MTELPFDLLLDVEFFDLINNNQFNSSNIIRHGMLNLDQLNGMVLDLQHNDYNRYLHDSDPDINFFHDSNTLEDTDSIYIYDDQFKNLSELNASNFTIMSYKISSLPKNFDYLADVMLSDTSLDIVGLCETRLSPDIDQLYELDGYSLYANDRSRNGGGVALYVSNRSDGHFARKDLTYMRDAIETVAVEIPGATRDSVVLMVYRKPSGDLNEFIGVMNDIMDTLSRENKHNYILGDFNINLLNHDSDIVLNFISLMYSFNFRCAVNKPTRSAGQTATLIDHIWSNNSTSNIKNLIIYSNISDHFPIVSYFKENDKSKISSPHSEYYTRCFTQNNINRFLTSLDNVSWDLVFQAQDAQVAYTNFISIYKPLFELNFPLELKKTRSKKNKPYVNEYIQTLIKEKNRLQRKHSRYPLTYDKEYKRIRNLVTKEIKKSKSKFYRDEFQECSGNTKKTWNKINSVLNNDKTINKY